MLEKVAVEVESSTPSIVVIALFFTLLTPSCCTVGLTVLISVCVMKCCHIKVCINSYQIPDGDADNSSFMLSLEP